MRITYQGSSISKLNVELFNYLCLDCLETWINLHSRHGKIWSGASCDKYQAPYAILQCIFFWATTSSYLWISAYSNACSIPTSFSWFHLLSTPANFILSSKLIFFKLLAARIHISKDQIMPSPYKLVKSINFLVTKMLPNFFHSSLTILLNPTGRPKNQGSCMDEIPDSNCEREEWSETEFK